MRGLTKFLAVGVTMVMMLAAFSIMPAMAVDVDAPDAGGSISVSVVYPHISGIDMFSGITPVLNDYVDVSNAYTLTVTGWYDYGANQVDQIDVWMWRDDGITVPEPDMSAGVDAGAPNGGVHLLYNGITFSIASTLTADPEWSINVGLCSFTPVVNAYTAVFAFMPNAQVWSARGTFTEPTFPGNQRYDPGANGTNPEDQMDASAPFAPLNDINTWDIKVVVQDVGKGVSDPSWDEFGVYQYSAISTAGWAYGGDVDGAGPSNTMGVALPNADSDWTFISNTQYDLKVSIDTDLLLGGVGPTNIPAANIYVMGGNIGTLNAFTGPTAVQYVLGNVAANTGQAASAAGTTTSISGLGLTAVGWSCDIPARPMGTYTSTITYALDLDP